MTKPVLAIHGGAGAITRAQITPSLQRAYEEALRDVLNAGSHVLMNGGQALDAAVEAVRRLEDCPLFNAGHGAVFTSEATHELDAAVMDGRTQACGAVAGLTTVRNPVLAARAVMEHSPHVFLIGAGAEAFARQQALECVSPAYFSTPQRRTQLDQVQKNGARTIVLDHGSDPGQASAPLDEQSKMGTVGAVALDMHGNLAAATSTGGMTNKWPGRVGDTPIIGAGCYARNGCCAVATTGQGEAFIRTVAAHDIAAQMAYAGRSLEDAAHQVVHVTLPPLDGAGGLVAIDAQGRVIMPFNTEGMYRGYIRPGQPAHVAIYRT